MEGETFNKFFAGRRGDNVVSIRLGFDISKADAVNLACWLLAIAMVKDILPAYREVCGE